MSDNPYNKYGVNSGLCDDVGNPIYTYGVTDDWLIWELNHGNKVNLAECCIQSPVKWVLIR